MKSLGRCRPSGPGALSAYRIRRVAGDSACGKRPRLVWMGASVSDELGMSLPLTAADFGGKWGWSGSAPGRQIHRARFVRHADLAKLNPARPRLDMTGDVRAQTHVGRSGHDVLS